MIPEPTTTAVAAPTGRSSRRRSVAHRAARLRSAHGSLAAVVPPLVVLVASSSASGTSSPTSCSTPRRRFLLHPPHEVVQDGFLDRDNFSEILDGLWSSSRWPRSASPSPSCSASLIAVVMSQAKLIERAVFPYMVTLQAIPILALVPLIRSGSAPTRRRGCIVCVIISFFPIIAQHAVRAAVGRPRDARPVHPAPRRPLDPAAQADVPGRPAGDLRRAAHLRRAVGDRRHRRRLLLRPRRRRHRPADPQVSPNTTSTANSCSRPSSCRRCSASPCSCPSARSSTP